ncbi:basic proline-rich protein-like [Mesoplodon densirostris]|uniref:basic proline-rich protein-like n=1 Tax=Mesoplodon densirostris TaxID=48708 RepID=UPI0028DC9D3B|nr:basic proline-rich protein-like [Mesoplodon densirostris]
MLLSSHRAEQEDTPLTLRSPLSRGSFILSPGPPAVPAEPPLARLRQRAQRGRKIVFLGARPGGEAGPGGSPTAPAPAAQGSAPRPSCPASAGSPPRPRSQAQARRPLQASVRSASGSQSPASSTADGQGAGADGPEPCGPKRSGAPRARPVAGPSRGPPPTHHPLSPPACARQQPLAPAPHLRRSPDPSSPPEPAVYTGSDVSGPAPPPPQADAGWLQTKRLGAVPNHALRERGGDGPAPPCLGMEDLQMGQPGWGLRTGGQSPQVTLVLHCDLVSRREGSAVSSQTYYEN